MSEEGKKSSRWLLIVSLTFNVFFVGTLVGGGFVARSMHHGPEGVRHAPPIHSFASPRKVLRATNPEDRKAMIKLVRKDRKEIHPLLQDVGKQRREAITAMGADSFDEAATLATLRSLVEAESKAHATSNETLVRMLASLSDDERKRIVETLGRSHRGKYRGQGRGDRRRWQRGPEPKPEQEPESDPEG